MVPYVFQAMSYTSFVCIEFRKQYSTGKQGTAQKSHANAYLRFACSLSAGQSVPVGFGDEAQAKATGFEAQAKAKVQAKPPKGFEAQAKAKCFEAQTKANATMPK